MKRFFSGLFAFIQNICLGIVICLIGITTFLYFSNDFNINMLNLVEGDGLMAETYGSDFVGYDVQSRETSLIASEKNGAKKILIPVENGKAYLRSTQIMYAGIFGNKSRVVMDSDHSFISTENTTSIHNKLKKANKSGFFKTKFFTLNLEYIREVKSENVGTSEKPEYERYVIMADGKSIDISQEKHSNLTKIMKRISIN